MSRVGKQPIAIPDGVKITVRDDLVQVEGPKGKLQTRLPTGITAQLEDSTLVASRSSDEKQQRALHGLARALLANTVSGVHQGFQKQLDVVGIGYKAAIRGRYLSLSLGFSHPIEFPIPEDVEISVARTQRQISNYVATVTVQGIDKQRVGQVAAEIRRLRPPDAYKGKGVRYTGELVRLKVGKKGA